MDDLIKVIEVLKRFDHHTVKEELWRLEELVKKAKINPITTGIEAARKERHGKDN